jgi:hypothetical protein
MIIIAWFFSITMLILAIYVPLFQKLLKTVPLNLFDWLLFIGLGIINLALIELTKFFFIRKNK